MKNSVLFISLVFFILFTSFDFTSSSKKIENSKPTITSLAGFEVKHAGIMVRGVFGGFNGVINFFRACY